MNTTAEKLQSIVDSKAAIKAAIIAKGVSCGDTLSDYANRIAAIPTAKAEETKTVDITANGTFTVQSSSTSKVLSKVVVNVKTEQIHQISCLVSGTSTDKNSTGLYTWTIDFVDEDQSEIEPGEFPDPMCFLNLGSLYEHCTEVLEGIGGTGVDTNNNEFIVTSRDAPFMVVFLKGADADPTSKFVNGILWYYPGNGHTIYGQNF